MYTQAVKRELARRKALLDSAFQPQQRDLVDSNALFISVLTSRRAGKTTGALIKILKTLYKRKNGRAAYIALSRRSAREIVWNELIELNDRFNLGLDLREYTLTAILPNGASLTLYGAKQRSWLSKFKGLKYDIVVIDECNEFDLDLRDMFYRVLRPTLIDRRGPLIAMGNCGPSQSGFWWELTREEKEKRPDGWTHFWWHTTDNPHIREQYLEEVAALEKTFGKEALYEMPWFIREWLGRWTIDTTELVYGFDHTKNTIDTWEHTPGNVYIISVDPCVINNYGAIVVGCYNNKVDNHLYYVDCWKKAAATEKEMADAIAHFLKKYPGARVIGDPAAADYLNDLRARCQINIENAIKVKKKEGIALMNNDFLLGIIKLKMPECRDYAKELACLKRVYRPGTWEEDKKMENDACDAGLYLHREAHPHLFAPEKPIDLHGTKAYYENVARKMRMNALKGKKHDGLL